MAVGADQVLRTWVRDLRGLIDSSRLNFSFVGNETDSFVTCTQATNNRCCIVVTATVQNKEFIVDRIIIRDHRIDSGGNVFVLIQCRHDDCDKWLLGIDRTELANSPLSRPCTHLK